MTITSLLPVHISIALLIIGGLVSGCRKPTPPGSQSVKQEVIYDKVSLDTVTGPAIGNPLEVIVNHAPVIRFRITFPGGNTSEFSLGKQELLERFVDSAYRKSLRDDFLSLEWTGFMKDSSAVVCLTFGVDGTDAFENFVAIFHEKKGRTLWEPCSRSLNYLCQPHIMGNGRHILTGENLYSSNSVVWTPSASTHIANQAISREHFIQIILSDDSESYIFRMVLRNHLGDSLGSWLNESPAEGLGYYLNGDTLDGKWIGLDNGNRRLLIIDPALPDFHSYIPLSRCKVISLQQAQQEKGVSIYDMQKEQLLKTGFLVDGSPFLSVQE